MRVFRLLFCCFFIFVAGLLQADLIHRYQFNDNVDDSVLEGGVNGTVVSGTDIVAPKYTDSDRPDGATGKSIHFDVERANDGAGDTIQKSLFSLDSEVFGASQSIAVWFKMDPRNTDNTVVDYLFNFSGTHGLSASVNKNYELGVKNNSTSFDPQPVFKKIIEHSTWYHLAITWNDTNDRLSAYLNGVAFAEQEAVNLAPTGQFTYFGAHSTGSNNPSALANQFDGKLYDVQFYSNRLNAGQIDLLYKNPGSAYPVPELRNTGLLLGLALATYFIARRRFLPDAV